MVSVIFICLGTQRLKKRILPSSVEFPHDLGLPAVPQYLSGIIIQWDRAGLKTAAGLLFGFIKELFPSLENTDLQQ